MKHKINYLQLEFFMNKMYKFLLFVLFTICALAGGTRGIDYHSLQTISLRYLFHNFYKLTIGNPNFTEFVLAIVCMMPDVVWIYFLIYKTEKK